MAFEQGELEGVVPFISEDVFEAFASVIDQREQQGLTIEATFIGLSEMTLVEAEFDETTKEAEMTVRFKSELAYLVRDKGGDVVEGDPNEIKRYKDVWTFSHDMGSDDPNWRLVATGE